MKKINFITNQDINTSSGGWSGINFNIFHELSNYFDVNYVGPISPRMQICEKLISKLRRSIGLQGNFSFFSEKRLEIIARQVNSQLTETDYNFYFGQAPWVNCKSQLPYGVYMDADFRTYLKIYSTPNQFKESDVKRICVKEEKWLQGASHIFVGSQWTWDEMAQSYDLDESKKVIIHTGGNIEAPMTDTYQGGLNFLFISLNFEKKGGFICVEAFGEIYKSYPKATLTIIGQEPPQNVRVRPGIIYAGMLRKTVPEDRKKFKKILANTFLLIHPTKMDTMGAVLVEAGYFGCPSIAPRRFGIPELIKNNITGLIIDDPFSVNDLISKIYLLIENSDIYSKMRIAVRQDTINRLSWNVIGIKLSRKINSVILENNL